MLTKEERAEIIERLLYVDYIYDGTLYRSLFGCDAPNDASFEEDSKAILERLADLIDPVCHLVEVNDGGDVSYTCSSCGNFGSKEVQLLNSFNYCPVCGSRVVRDEA